MGPTEYAKGAGSTSGDDHAGPSVGASEEGLLEDYEAGAGSGEEGRRGRGAAVVVSPEEENKEAVLLDVRNVYETSIGHFRYVWHGIFFFFVVNVSCTTPGV